MHPSCEAPATCFTLQSIASHHHICTVNVQSAFWIILLTAVSISLSSLNFLFMLLQAVYSGGYYVLLCR